MGLFLIADLLLTQPAIESIEALKIISLIFLAAIVGPLVIGTLFFLLKSDRNT